MKTIKNMWAMSKFATVLTLFLAVFVVVLLAFLWWMPVNFDYPWYTIVGNAFVTILAVFTAREIAEVVNN